METCQNCPSGKLSSNRACLDSSRIGLKTSLGIKAANGVVIATEKKLPSILVDETSVQKIQCLTPNIGVVYRFLFILQLSGKLGYSVLLVGDILDLINMHIALNCLKIKSATISVFCQCLKQGVQKEHLVWAPIFEFWFEKVESRQNSIIDCISGVKPFGVSLLVAGYDDNGPQLYQDVKAIGLTQGDATMESSPVSQTTDLRPTFSDNVPNLGNGGNVLAMNVNNKLPTL
ncbi:hypothetical protein GOBAR_DD21395 [Gossypium barbadense]|nr:hypothetical protein GOBAR_DD21395 [Gossypium barbadense]